MGTSNPPHPQHKPSTPWRIPCGCSMLFTFLFSWACHDVLCGPQLSPTGRLNRPYPVGQTTPLTQPAIGLSTLVPYCYSNRGPYSNGKHKLPSSVLTLLFLIVRPENTRGAFCSLRMLSYPPSA